jgi:hypothetical protein
MRVVQYWKHIDLINFFCYSDLCFTFVNSDYRKCKYEFTHILKDVNVM